MAIDRKEMSPSPQPFAEVQTWLQQQGIKGDLAARYREVIAQAVVSIVLPRMGAVPIAVTGGLRSDSVPEVRLDLVYSSSNSKTEFADPTKPESEGQSTTFERRPNPVEFIDSGVAVVDSTNFVETALPGSMMPKVVWSLIDPVDPDWDGRTVEEIIKFGKEKGDFNIGTYLPGTQK